MHGAVMARDVHRELAETIRHGQPLAKRGEQLLGAPLVAVMRGQRGSRRRSLAEVVRKHREAHRRGGREPRRDLEREQHVHAGVDLGMPALGLRHAEERVDLGEHSRESAAVSQHFDVCRGIVLAERLGGFLPHALGLQGLDLAARHDLCHQLLRLGRDGKTELREPGREARDAQYAERILGECGRDVAQHARREIALASPWIDQRAIRRPRDRVDREIAALEILLERHRRGGIELEAGVAAADLALGARERVFVAGARMEKDGEVLADAPVALREQLVGRSADDDPVALLDRQAEQGVAYRPADLVNFHGPHHTVAS